MSGTRIRQNESGNVLIMVTLSIFVIFSIFYLKEPLTWQHLLGFAFIAGGAALIFKA